MIDLQLVRDALLKFYGANGVAIHSPGFTEPVIFRMLLRGVA
jgi:hypothetical protein